METGVHVKREEMDTDETESDWFGYTCKSEEILFYYNIKTGEHRWATDSSNCSENTILQIQISEVPPKPNKLCSAATQTEDYGCVNQCTSMYVDNERQMKNRESGSNEIKAEVRDDDTIDGRKQNASNNTDVDDNLDEVIKESDNYEINEVSNDDKIDSDYQNASNNTDVGDTLDKVNRDFEIEESLSTIITEIKRRKELEQNVHPQQKSNPKSHNCPYCSWKFKCRSKLDRHVRIHTGEKPYGCSYCEKTFARNCYLKNHLRTHTGEKPYKCPYCDKTFAWQCHHKVHLRTHTGEKPYKCTYCDKAFVEKSGLNRHLQTHPG